MHSFVILLEEGLAWLLRSFPIEMAIRGWSHFEAVQRQKNRFEWCRLDGSQRFSGYQNRCPST